MNVSLGIDLGSTTCKAVVLDDQGEILGKGITNTRSNYTMATKIATFDALTNARFTRLCRMGNMTEAEREEVEILYHQADYLKKHQALVERLLALDKAAGRGSHGAVLKAMGAYVEERFQQEVMRKEIADRTKFFKDFMMILYLEAAERFLPSEGLEEEMFFGLLDKVIVGIENELYPLSPEQVLAELLPPEKLGILETMKTETLTVVAQVGTGYGRQLLPFEPSQIRAEILCHARGAYALFPATRTILDIGGQDTKAIQLDGQGTVRSFFMNDRCAAGCGRYLGYVAEEMGMGLPDLGPAACRACKAIPISSTCTVFAGAELRDLLYAGEDKNEILLGLHRAIVLRALSLLARSGGVFNECTFTGGVAKNQAVTKILRELVDKNYRDITLNIHPDSIYMGALGAALYARESL